MTSEIERINNVVRETERKAQEDHNNLTSEIENWNSEIQNCNSKISDMNNEIQNYNTKISNMTSEIERVNNVLVETQNKGQEETVNMKNEIESLKRDAQ